MKAILFGVSGQDGFYLKNILRSKNIEVIGVSRSEGEWLKGSVAEFSLVENLIKQHKPDFIFHLAANSTTKHEVIFENHGTISTGSLNILESVKKHSPGTKVFLAGSGVQFKNNGDPIKENDEFEGNSPYSVARIQSVYAARYFRSLNIKTYVGYLFHHESPLRKDHHISKLTTNYIRAISGTTDQKLVLGDISVKKEWAFAEDIAEGIYALISQDKIFEACIGTGITYSIEDWLKTCFEIKGLDYNQFIELPSIQFKPEYAVLVSDPSSMNKIGWKAKTSFLELAKIMCS